MSIVAEVLECAEKIDVEFINQKVPDIKKKLDSCRNQVVETIENVYVKYNNRFRKDDILLTKISQAQESLSLLKEKATFLSTKELVKTNSELAKNIEEFHYIDFSLQAVKYLLTILNLLHNFDAELGQCSYLKCVEIIKELKEKIDGIPSDEYLDVIDELKLTLSEKEMRLQTELKNIFTDNIEVQERPEKKIILKVKRPNKEIELVMVALYSYKDEIYPLNCFTKSLWDSILVPIVNHEVSITEVEDKTFVSLNLSLINASKKSNYKKVFDNLKTVLHFLQNNFEYEISKDLTTLSYIGNDIRDNLSELIIKNCLRDTIPADAKELQNYNIVIDQTKELEKALLDAKIFTDNTASILEYASNVDILFINKKCDEYLASATAIMKKDLHDLVEVGVPYDPDYPLGRQLREFPQCSISKNTQELLKLCEKILQESLNASPECSGRLFTTVTNILLKYPVFVSEFHKDYLATLPQQVALFFNNCQYISHILVKWNMEYCNKLAHTLVTCNFTAESTQIPTMALEMFSNYIEGQMKQIDEIMNGAQLVGPMLEMLNSNTEKCIRQCLRQQELLRTVWHKVLPYNVFNKNIGSILDTLCKNVINSTVKFEDITTTGAEQLVEVIKLILTRASKLFTNPNEVTLFVPSWYKLNELSFVLNANLVEINDRWADGKGPLALQFEASELRQLVKALFQNTSRRAALLDSISVRM